LTKIEDGGFMLDKWYQVLIKMELYNIDIMMGDALEPEVKISDVLEKIEFKPTISAHDGYFAGGSIGMVVNSNLGTNFD
jgi:hypothetical protein